MGPNVTLVRSDGPWTSPPAALGRKVPSVELSGLAKVVWLARWLPLPFPGAQAYSVFGAKPCPGLADDIKAKALAITKGL